MSADYEAVIAGAFVDFLDKGYVYKGLKPVQLVHQLPHRAGRSRSRVREPHQPVDLGALRADVATRRRSIPRSPGAASTGLIWTTTPWTIPANMAIAFHPKFEYVGGGGRRATSTSSRATC